MKLKSLYCCKQLLLLATRLKTALYIVRLQVSIFFSFKEAISSLRATDKTNKTEAMDRISRSISQKPMQLRLAGELIPGVAALQNRGVIMEWDRSAGLLCCSFSLAHLLLGKGDFFSVCPVSITYICGNGALGPQTSLMNQDVLSGSAEEKKWVRLSSQVEKHIMIQQDEAVAYWFMMSVSCIFF